MKRSFRKYCQRAIGPIAAILFFCVIFLPDKNIHAKETDCLSCHGYRTMAAYDNGASKPLYVDVEAFKASSHGKAACSGCHDDFKDLPHKKDRKKVDCTRECHIVENGAERVYSHKDAAEAVSVSVHSLFGRDGNLKKNSSLIPDCAGCHPFDHSSKRSFAKKQLHSLMSKDLVIKVCGGCHSRPEVLSKFNLSDVLSSYNETFHGKQRCFGRENMPDCIDCHADPEKGAHIIRGRDAGKMTVNCKTGDCHKSAGEGLKGFHVHVSYDKKKYPIESYVRLMLRVLTFLVVFSLLGIVFLELFRRIFPNFTLLGEKERR